MGRFEPPSFLTRSGRRWALLLLLGFLHALLIEGVGGGVARTLLAMHLGMFFLWQPFVRAERRLSGFQVGAICVAVAAAATWLSWGLLVVWVMVLAGIIGGKVLAFSPRGVKLLHLFALTYLIGVLTVFLVPHLLPRPFVNAPEFDLLARYVLPGLFAAMALLPIESQADDAPEVVDFVHSALVLLILAVLALGTISAMLLFGRGYIESLIFAIAALSAVLFLLAWAWNPGAGFAGLNTLFSRYLFSIGLPVERWLHYLAEHAQREDKPERFLDEALGGMASLPWVLGGAWQAGGKRGEFGRREGKPNAFRHGGVAITLYTRHAPGPALVWHFNLLTRLLADFYEAKVRGQELQQLSYVKAIHETGARLTHDVKNLLQSLNTLCFAATSEQGEGSPQFQALLRRQLPAIARRLQQTLDKLQRPAGREVQHAPLGAWWAALRARYTDAGIVFRPEALDSARPVPAILFDSVAENLIENALAKRRESPALRIEASLVEQPEPRLAVSDDGDPIPEETAAALFTAPVSSHNGLGIGLYQAARHAEHFGYALAVAENRPGRVCLELRGLTAGAVTPD